MNLPVNAGRSATVNGIAFQDMHSLATFQIGELPVGDSEIFYVWVRRSTDGQNGYRIRCEFTSTGTLQVRTQKVVANAVTSIGTLKTLSLTPSIGDIYVAEIQAVGINPTTLQANVYRQADGRPATWLNDNTDTETTLQVATLGAAWSWFVQALNTNAPLNVYVLEYYINQLVPAPPVNVPPTISSVVPLDTQVFNTAPGAQTITFDALANVADTDGTVVGVTLTLNAGSPQNVNQVGGQWKKTLTLGAGNYTIQWIATDDDGASGSAVVSFTVVATPAPVIPPPVVDSVPGAVEFIVQFVTHDGVPVGELKGTNLRFGRFIGQPGYISFDIDRTHPLAPVIFSEPNKLIGRCSVTVRSFLPVN